jgi:DNA invertase Pin-like site-specific DNA recombinase
MNTQRSTNAAKVAVGYVRVSTQEQVSEGVSLDTQRDKLKGYCKLNGIKLIDIKADEGISGGTLERPGLREALGLLRRGRANTLIVVKLDRLSRSLRDVCTLVEDYFSDERFHLLSLCGMVNTHSAAGRMVLMNLANYAQFEREIISERTRDALRHMMVQGVRLGPAPYGYEFSQDVDDQGRRLLVPLAHEQEVVAKIKGMRAEGLKLHQIARRLNEAKIPARRDGVWRAQRLSIVLRRDGTKPVLPKKPQGPRIPLRYDREAATALAMELRAQGLSFNQIGQRLRKAKLTPQRGGKWFPAQVSELLRTSSRGDREAAARRAIELRAEGMQLREIGVRLVTEGILPKEGGIWHPAQVHGLLALAESVNRGG